MRFLLDILHEIDRPHRWMVEVAIIGGCAGFNMNEDFIISSIRAVFAAGIDLSTTSSVASHGQQNQEGGGCSVCPAFRRKGPLSAFSVFASFLL